MCEERSRLECAVVCQYAAQAASALAHVHSLNIIHRGERAAKSEAASSGHRAVSTGEARLQQRSPADCKRRFEAREFVPSQRRRLTC